ncbi:MAG: coenzyme A pyrophosphatase [Crocinitomicaceae bacterium]|nr:coenzyme A pyrophosphatase [Crocinitomicaceae bacterium]|tara:strand:+ start:7204 stop:7845 length:642 start_codon:yes stop_codon:yes gene_type:complete
MNFQSFIDQVRLELSSELPGEDAQMLMSPLGRATQREAIKQIPNPTPSAILILIYPVNNVPHTLLMVRNSYDGHHSGQVSFPGGKVEPSDKNLAETALREFEEEIGVGTSSVEVLGELSSLIIPPSGFQVFPYVGFLDQPIVPQPDPTEVAGIVETSITNLFDSRNKRVEMVNSSVKGFKLKAPCYVIDNNIIWGATAMILSEFESIYKRFEF